MESWQEHILKLDKSQYHVAKLRIDGHQVSFHNYLHKRKLIIMWHVNGWYKGEFANAENEVGQKFGRPMYLKRGKAFYDFDKLVHGKRKADRIKKEDEKKVITHHFTWSNAVDLVRHLKKTCTDFEIITDEKEETE